MHVLYAQARNPYSQSRWIPGSLAVLAPRNDDNNDKETRMAYETIKYDVADQILTITLNRPDKLNAFNQTMMNELIDAFDKADADDNVRAVIVTGEGRGFCAGADLSSGGDTFDRDAKRGPARRLANGDVDYSDPGIRDGGGQVTLRIFKCLKPVIGAINGPAVGIGATMTLPMDIRLASDSARFGFVFAARGIVPEAASSWFLPRLVGIQQALEWCYTARVFPAAEALDGGLVRSLHPPEDLLDAARTLATEIAANSAPVSVALTRQLMWKGLVAGHPMEAHRMDSPGVTTTGSGADAREGITAFFEKRPPEWRQQVPGDLPDWFPWWDQPSFDS